MGILPTEADPSISLLTQSKRPDVHCTARYLIALLKCRGACQAWLSGHATRQEGSFLVSNLACACMHCVNAIFNQPMQCICSSEVAIIGACIMNPSVTDLITKGRIFLELQWHEQHFRCM